MDILSAEKGYVYLVSPVGKNIYKVGETIDIQKRFARKEKEKDYKLTLIHGIEVDYKYAWDIENTIHRMYSRLRLAGDWFVLNQDLVDGFPQLVRDIENKLKGNRK